MLNKPAYANAKILVAGDNFGCGSSREHAPWALLDFGIRCVISTDFADIFYNNCFKNGILPIKVSPEDLDEADGRRAPRRQRDADHRSRRPRKSAAPTAAWCKFEIDPFRKHCLIEGLDDIGLTMVEAPAIAALREEGGGGAALALSALSRAGVANAREGGAQRRMDGVTANGNLPPYPPQTERGGEARRAPALR